ncbi:MAG: LrgB family protein [Gammaproteobacteria bacterium]|jgi:predicted murein hydrolase (TIGR00659 family)|nr:LrgB family protein [Gammaproteobacteria bacterium]
MSLDWQAALDALIQHPLFAFGLTLGVYQVALAAYEKTRWMIFQPVLVSMVILITTLLVLRIDYADYKQGTQLLTVILGPATVALAVPLYLNMRRVRQVLWPTLITLFVGGLFATVLGVALAWLFGAETLILKTIAPKSVTTPIAMLVAEEIGGAASLAAVFVMLTGVLGAMLGPEVLRLLRITHSAAQGMALGIVAHAVGTARALQESEEAGAFAALAMSIMGVLTAVLMPLAVAVIV